MHAIQVNAGGPSIAAARPSSSYVPCITFTPGQMAAEMGEQRIGQLVAERTNQKRFFYGIELMASNIRGKPTCVDFNNFLPLLPTFVSIVWLSQRYWGVEPVDQVESLQLTEHLATNIPVLTHLSAYRLDKERLDKLLAMNITSVLAVRGDQVHEGQDYQISLPIVVESKQKRGEKISVCVGGYPEGYTSLGDFPPDLAKNMEYLKAKVSAGADCIITQLSYQPEVIVQFVRDCRAAGITIPIVIGLMAHESIRTYRAIQKIANIHLPTDLREELNQLIAADGKDMITDQDPIKKFFVRLTVETVRHILDADVGIWGFHFFTLNHFKPVKAVLQELRKQNLLKDLEQDK